MRISGEYDYNGARYMFISLQGDFKWVYRQLLMHMKKWNILCGQINVNDELRYTVFVCKKCIFLYRCNDGRVCSFRRVR